MPHAIPQTHSAFYPHRSLRSLVRFLTRQQLVRKYRTPALAMKYSLYIRAVFNNLTAKIELSPQTFFFIRTKTLKKSTLKLGGQPLLFFFSYTFFPLRFFYFPFLRSFLGGISGSFCLRLLVFFSVKRLQFSFGVFSNIHQDNALAFYCYLYINFR